MPRKKKARGRPVSKPMPERIDATPEQLAQAMLSLPVDYEWQYLKEDANGYLKDEVDGEKDGE